MRGELVGVPSPPMMCRKCTAHRRLVRRPSHHCGGVCGGRGLPLGAPRRLLCCWESFAMAICGGRLRVGNAVGRETASADTPPTGRDRWLRLVCRPLSGRLELLAQRIVAQLKHARAQAAPDGMTAGGPLCLNCLVLHARASLSRVLARPEAVIMHRANLVRTKDAGVAEGQRPPHSVAFSNENASELMCVCTWRSSMPCIRR